MEDLIRREDAIGCFNEWLKRNHFPNLGEGILYLVPSADTDLGEYSDKLWKNAYERGKEEEHRWWSEHCAKCTDADRPQGEWLDTGKDPSHSHPLTAIWYKCSECRYGTNAKTNYCPNCGAKMKQ